jgi:hypothetical protein
MLLLVDPNALPGEEETKSAAKKQRRLPCVMETQNEFKKA